MNSIATRLLVSASLVLAGFVILTSLSVRHSVHTRAEQALYDRLQGLVYGILGASELNDAGELNVNEYELPDQRLLSPVPGTYAEVVNAEGQRMWQSTSTVTAVPEIIPLDVGTWRFSHHQESRGAEVRRLQFTTNWSTESRKENVYYLQVVNDATEFNAQLRNFDRNLWVSLLLSALLLLLIQLLVLTWGLNPLGKIGRGLKKIESGEEDLLDNRLPVELRPLADSMNTLLQSERNRHLRYRNVMDDLAHSLKTPLSVMRNLPDDGVITEQTSRMQDIIAYHLQRASAQGAQALAAPVSPLPALERLSASLKKVYQDQQINFQFNLTEDFTVRINEADLMEILGNLLENSCKYGATDIHVEASRNAGKLLMHIDDNGPGFPAEHIRELSKRGIRADSAREGQGLGLAVSRELMESYGGALGLSNRQGGGARVTLLFA
ncbi:MAG: hypothetical protein KTR33_04100 [Gammaproteobacteria bacterium]|nr:hypothetical protein [Gammaproteobacteria bacterium]